MHHTRITGFLPSRQPRRRVDYVRVQMGHNSSTTLESCRKQVNYFTCNTLMHMLSSTLVSWTVPRECKTWKERALSPWFQLHCCFALFCLQHMKTPFGKTGLGCSSLIFLIFCCSELSRFLAFFVNGSFAPVVLMPGLLRISTALGVNMISWKFCKKMSQNPPIGCVKLSFGISGQKRYWIFLDFSSCVPVVLTQEWYFKHLNINTLLLWLNNQWNNNRFVF